MGERLDQKTTRTTILDTDLIMVTSSTGKQYKAQAGGTIINKPVVLTDGATISWNYSTGNIATITLGGNRILSINNVSNNSFGVIKVIQDATGGRTLSLPGNTPPGWGLSAGANEVDILGFYFDGSSYWWSKETYGTTLPTLATPGSFTAVAASGTQINLSWASVTSATGYVIQRATDISFTSGLTTVYSGSGTSYNDTGLSSNTTYYYRIKATASGYNDSSYATANATTSSNYLTWTTIGADMEQYNTSKGMRKKSSGSTGWASPNVAACLSEAVETLSSGQSITLMVSASPSNATAIILSATTPDEGGITGVDFGIYSGYGLSANAMAQENNASLGTSFAISAGDLLRITYGSNMVFEQSTNGGTSWTTKATSAGTPSGTYSLFVQSYSPLGGFDELFK